MATHPSRPRGTNRKPKRVNDRGRVTKLEEAVETLQEAPGGS